MKVARKLKVEDEVQIYLDPLTEKEWEGTATIKFILSENEETIYASVIFNGFENEGYFHRTIKK